MNTNQTIRVIIADDEASIRDGLCQAVHWNQLGMSVIGTAKDGEEAWSYIRMYHPAIAVTDIRMPHLSGLDLIKRCREEQISTEFIILSGYDDFSYAQTAIRYGARAYILKPLKIEELVTELEDLKSSILNQRNASVSYLPEDYQSLQISSKKLFLKQLIQNDFRHSSDIYPKLQELHLPLTDSYYRILVFSLIPGAYDSPPETVSRFIQHARDTAKKLRHAIWENSRDQIVMIVHYDSPDEKNFFVTLVHACLRPFPQIIAGIGSPQKRLIDASRSYSQALTVLSYRLYEEPRTIYDDSVICTQPPTMSSNSIDTTELIRAINKNDEAAITAFCRSYFSSLLYVPMPPPSFIRGMLIYLITDVQNALRKLIHTDENMFPEFAYTAVHQLPTLRELENWTTSLFLSYSRTMKDYLSQNKDGIIVDAKQYIKKHMSQKIQAEDVAAYVNLSTSYFSAYFKAKTGVNFRDYILNIKMEHAKHLLEAGPANISEISYAVGYDDYRSFYRAFKNHTGMTPSEYQAKA